MYHTRQVLSRQKQLPAVHKNIRGFSKFGTFRSDSPSDCSNKGTSYWIGAKKDHAPLWVYKI